ncbi:hypothetical protein E1A91_D01G097600v1 [Gossypium mustelinum]|uniref:Uncharacterized protein n=1 Tax=Gossypium mustelinum TaxID=34275 RepID=A0A5D2W582_GOSMU|nr:hypothetical protein E1A91_D01G097600v1 [Gossypium mustelinum]
MKILGTSRPLPLPLYNNSPPFSHPHLSPSIFPSTHYSHKFSQSMAACIDISRTTDSSQLSQRPNISQPDEVLYEYGSFCRSTFPNNVSSVPLNKNHTKTIPTRKSVDFSLEEKEEVGALWLKMKEEARYCFCIIWRLLEAASKGLHIGAVKYEMYTIIPINQRKAAYHIASL